MKWFWHIHIWKVKEKQLIDSPFKTLINSGRNLESLEGGFSFFKTKVIVTYGCQSCSVEKVEVK